MSNIFLGFEYASGKNSFCDEKFSIAGELVAFSSEKLRNSWIEKGENTRDMGYKNCRESTNKNEARTKFCTGLNREEYDFYVDSVVSDIDERVI